MAESRPGSGSKALCVKDLRIRIPLNSVSETVFIFSSHLLDKRVLPRAARPGDEAAGRSRRRRGLWEAVREVRHLQVRQQILRLPAQVIPYYLSLPQYLIF
jgi:hypothetical protein